jgi:acyl-CoA dehydrogenase
MFFTADHAVIAERVRNAAAAVTRAEAAAASRGELAAAVAVTRAMAATGLFELLLPERGTVDVCSLCLVREALGYVSPLADAIFAVQGLGSTPLLLAGSTAQRGLLPQFRSGQRVGAFALTEPDAGSDIASLTTVARRDHAGTGWLLDGEKTLISNVGIATDYVVFANVDPSAGRNGITAFLMPADAPGLVATPIPMGAAHPVGRLELRTVAVPDEARIGNLGEGFRLAMQTLDTFRITVGAAAVGMARRALDLTLAHVRGRVQFGKPLGEQQLVQAMVAGMAVDLDSARLLVLRAAYAKDRRDAGTIAQPSVEAAIAKLHATEAAQRVVDAAVQLHGGRGVVAGEAVENLYRAIRPLRIYEGTSEIQQLIIGRALVKVSR